MSSSLFILVTDILSKDLGVAARVDRCKPHPACHDSMVTHLSFADGALIFLMVLVLLYREFQKCYTSFMLLLAAPKSEKVEIVLRRDNHLLAGMQAASLGLLQWSLPIRYLGLPLLPHEIKSEDFQPLLDKVHKRITSWLVRPLSFAGILQLIQSVLCSLVNFWAVFFSLLKKCLDELEGMFSVFLWSGAPNSLCGANVSWASIFTPKKQGLGLKDLKFGIQSLLLS